MSNIIKILFDICLLRKGPEDLPANSVLMLVLIAISLIVSIWIGLIIFDKKIAIITSIAELIFSIMFAKILLIKNPERFTQTFSAMLGTVTLINIISLPILIPLSHGDLNQNISSLLGLLSFALLIWVVVVYGSIFSRAISSVLSYGISISVGYALLSIIISQLLLAARVSS